MSLQTSSNTPTGETELITNSLEGLKITGRRDTRILIVEELKYVVHAIL